MKMRNQRKNNFTPTPNAMLLNPALSLQAKGLLAIMLSRPDDWNYYMTWLEKQSTNGRESHQSAMKELIVAGYVARESARGGRGRFAGYEYIVSDEPMSPANGFTATVKPSDGLSVDGKPATTNTEYTNTELTNTEKETSLFEKTKNEDTRTLSMNGEEGGDTSIEAEIVETPAGYDKTPAELVIFFMAWNRNCGVLPKSHRGKEAVKLLKRELKDKTPTELEYAISCGAQLVSADKYWQQQNYGFVNLLRHLDEKAEKFQNSNGHTGRDAVAYSRARRVHEMSFGGES